MDIYIEISVKNCKSLFLGYLKDRSGQNLTLGSRVKPVIVHQNKETYATRRVSK
jgi:hypothetical protein